MSKALSIGAAALALMFAAVAPALSQSVLQVSVTAGGTTSTVAAGGSVALTATGVGQPVLASVTVLNTGTAPVTVTSASLTGTSEISIVQAPTFPVTLSPNATTSFTVEYVSSNGDTANAQVTIGFTANSQASTFEFGVTGTSPLLEFSYYFAPTGSLTNLTSGNTIGFPATNVGSTAIAVVNVLNLGSASGALQSVTLSGSAFQLSGSNAPTQLPPGQQTSFSVIFAPQAVGTNQGLLVVGLASGNDSFTLTGTGTSSSFAFTYTLSDGNVHALTNGTVITYPSVDINGTTSATLAILNQGTGAGTVTNISVSGTGFRLSGLPLLPATIPAGQSLQFQIVFAPTQPGAYSGTFSIVLPGSTISGSLAAATNPSNLAASYSISNGTAGPLTNGVTITYPAVAVNGTSTATVVISNSGTGTGTVSAITLSGAGFQLTGVPVLPANIAPSQSLQFSIVFAPTQAGTFTGSFQIGMTGVSISGSLSGSTTTPSFAFTYTLSDGIPHTLSNGATIAFPTVAVNGTTTATVVISNSGAGTGTVSSIALSGTGFELAGVPVLPANVAPSQTLQFSIIFAPTQSGAATGSFQINATGVTVAATLSGSTTTPTLAATYTLSDGIPHALSNATLITFPAIAVNGTTAATVVISNSGAGTGTVSSISLSGTGFQLSGVPVLPANVAPSQTLQFSIVFAPTQAGTFTGSFQINMTGVSIAGTLSGSTTTPSFAATYTLSDGVPHALSNGALITFPSVAVNSTTAATVVISNSGAGAGTVSGISLSGTGFQLTGVPVLPANVGPSQTLQFSIVFAPTQSGTSTGAFQINMTGVSIAGTLSGSTTAPAFSVTYSYYFAPAGSLTNLSSGGTIAFPTTNVGSTSVAVVTVLNSGTVSGTVQSVTLTGSAFQLSGSTAPTQLQPGQQASFNVTFAPQAVGTNQGLLVVALPNSSATFALTGTGTTSSFAFTYTLSDGNVHPLTNGTVIAFPSVDVNGTTTASIAILNQGTGAGTVTGISVSGTSFRLTGLPLLPATIAAGQNLQFQIVFSPTQQGAYSGTFGINLSGSSISGSLTASTNPSNLTASYSLSNGTAGPLANGALIIFPSVDVNGTTTAVVVITNSGTGTGTVSSIALSGAGFRLTGAPTPPVNIAPSQSLQFSVVFAPTQAGTFTGSLQIVMTGVTITATLSASTPPANFAITYTLADGNVHSLTNGSSINFPSVDINATATAAIAIVNQGTGAGSVSAVSVTGAGFKIASLQSLPATVAAGQSLLFQIVFAPTQAGSFNGTFSITLGGSTVSGTLAGSTSPASFSLAYVDPSTNNVIYLPNGSTLSFPNTLVNSVSNITLLAINGGTGTGFVNSIALGGSSPSVFQILNQPPLPASVPPSQQLSFGIRFSPLQQQTFSATLAVNLSGQTVTINLAAQGTGPQYTYTWSNTAGTNAISPGGTLAIPNTNVGQTSSVTVTVLNAGTGNGQVSVLSVTGQGLSITNSPALPFTLLPQGSQSFTLNFAPTQPSAVTGTLTVGTDTFNITATGIGSLLTYSYTNAGSTVTVAAGGVVIFQPTPVEGTASLTFSVQNTGTSSATISSINLAAASTVFSLQQLPTPPTNLNPGGTVTFSVTFVPNALGSLTATLLVNNNAFTLSGTGTQPASLPAYQFQGPSGTTAAAQQPSIGLTLSAPYPLALQGTLTLTFTSAVFTDDPSIQFAAGGRTVNFTIPANTTQALFTGGAAAMPMQTGTTAGAIVIAPTFALQNGFDLTPSSPTSLTLNIPESAANLSSESVASETTSGFIVILSGYSTTHALTQLNVQITPKQGQTFSPSTLTINVASASSAWFQSTASEAFGGTFSIAIPFVLSSGSSTADLVSLLQSLTITATNSVGTSNSITVPIP